MIRKVNNIVKVESFGLAKEGLIVKKQGDLFLNGEQIFNNILDFSIFKDFLICYIEAGERVKSITYKLGKKKEYLIALDTPLWDTKMDLILNNLNEDRKNWSYYLYDFEQEKHIFFSKASYFFGYPIRKIDNIFFTDETLKLVTNLEINTETTLWQNSVADLGAEKVSKILGVFGQALVVVGEIKENTFVLFGLDVQSGQLLWKHDTVFERNSDGRTLRVKLNLSYADTTSNKIIIFEAGFYIEIEGSSGQILKWIDVFKAPFQSNGLTMDAYAFDISQADEDHIYFRTSVPIYGMYTGAGIFNRKTDKLEFLEIIKNEKGNPVIIGPLKIQATKEKYYVLDTQNTLHIFEREEETPDLNQ